MNVEAKGHSQRASSFAGFAGNKFGSHRFHGYEKKSVVSARTLQSRIIIEEILRASLKIQRMYYGTSKRTPGKSTIAQ